MESRHFQEQEVPDHQRIASGSSSSQLQRPSPCPRVLRVHSMAESTARTVLAAILEIIPASGNDLTRPYPVPAPCPMVKCFHSSATPMEQIHHVTMCAEASKGEIRCWTCRKCHDFKKWHAVCNTLKSPVDLLRRLSNRKRGSNTNAGGPSATKRGKISRDDDFTTLSRQESYGIESAWPPELEDSTNFVPEIASLPDPALELDAEVNDIPLALGLRDPHPARPLPTPPSTRNHSWSENSQNLTAYGDAKVAHMPEQPPPYIVSPQTTVDDYQRHDDGTDSLRLGIPPVQYIHESNFMESPEDLEIPEADQPPWADHTVFHEAEDARVNLRLVPNVLDANVSAQYGDPSEKSASIFSNSYPAFRTPNPHRQKQNTWPTQIHSSNDIPRRSFDHRQLQIFDGVFGLAEQDGPATAGSQHDTSTEPSITRQTSFDAGAQDAITASTLESTGLQATSAVPEDTTHRAQAKKQPRSTHAGKQITAARNHHHHHHRQYEECARCGQQFGGALKNRRQHLKRHVASKHGDVRFRCGHPGCSRSYNRVDNLHDHEKKCHGGGGPEVVAELAAGDVEVRRGIGQQYHISSRVTAVAAGEEGPAAETRQTSSSAVGIDLAVFGYSISTQDDDGQGWRPAANDDTRDPRAGRRTRTAGFTEDEWDALMAGVCGGQQQQHEGHEGPGVPDVAHDEADTPDEDDGLSMGLGLAPRPLDIPCAPWRLLGG